MIDRVCDRLFSICPYVDIIMGDPKIDCACSVFQMLDEIPAWSRDPFVVTSDLLCSLVSTLAVACQAASNTTFINVLRAEGMVALLAGDAIAEMLPPGWEQGTDLAIAGLQNMVEHQTINPLSRQYRCICTIAGGDIGDLIQGAKEDLAHFERVLKQWLFNAAGVPRIPGGH